MRNYIIRRVLLMLPTLLLVSLIIFFLIRVIPGSIVDIMIGTMGEEGEFYTQETYDKIKEGLGLDAPIHIQYLRWIGNIILHGDFGKSLWTNVPVVEEIATKWPVTFELGLMALIIGQLIALPIGIYSALRQDTWGDYIARSFAIMWLAIPNFWLATMIIVFPSIWWGYSPSIMLIPFTEDPIGNLKMFILPAIVLGTHMSASTMRMTRTMLLEVLRQDYVRTAWAKGLRERVVILRHALKNALIPVITIVGMRIPVLVGGTVIMEQIFCLPGMGRLIIEATMQRNYTVLSGVMLLLGAVVMFVNLVVDITYAYLDPRVHYK